MEKIIACTDFSVNAKAAVEYAFALAGYYGAELKLAHSYLVPVPVSEVPPSVEMYEQIKKNAEQELGKLQNDLQKRNNKIIISTHLENENLLLCLEELSKKFRPDVVVLGTRGHRDFVDILVGSNTLKIINHLPAPVLVIPSGAMFRPFKKITFACDFEKVVETTPLDLLKKLITDFNADLHVVNVDYKNKKFTAETPTESMLLDHLLFKMKPKYHFLESKDIGAAMEEFVQKNEID
ncbi:MAG: universal stress protein, partial [Sphingobacteriales bacterium]